MGSRVAPERQDTVLDIDKAGRSDNYGEKGVKTDEGIEKEQTDVQSHHQVDQGVDLKDETEHEKSKRKKKKRPSRRNTDVLSAQDELPQTHSQEIQRLDETEHEKSKRKKKKRPSRRNTDVLSAQDELPQSQSQEIQGLDIEQSERTDSHHVARVAKNCILIPGSRVVMHSNTVSRKKSDWALLVADDKMNLTNNKFEIEVINTGNITMGLVPENYDHALVGCHDKSFGYHGHDGRIYIKNGHAASILTTAKKGDRISLTIVSKDEEKQPDGQRKSLSEKWLDGETEKSMDEKKTVDEPKKKSPDKTPDGEKEKSKDEETKTDGQNEKSPDKTSDGEKQKSLKGEKWTYSIKIRSQRLSYQSKLTDLKIGLHPCLTMLSRGAAVQLLDDTLLKVKGDTHIPVMSTKKTEDLLISTIWGILFIGVRVLAEGQPIGDLEYTGAKGYRTLSCIVMLLFLALTCAVMLNIFIAQLSSRYGKENDKVDEKFETHKARTIARYDLGEDLTSFLFIYRRNPMWVEHFDSEIAIKRSDDSSHGKDGDNYHCPLMIQPCIKMCRKFVLLMTYPSCLISYLIFGDDSVRCVRFCRSEADCDESDYDDFCL